MFRLLTSTLISLAIASSVYAQTSNSAYRPTHWDPLGRALDQFKDADGWIKEKTDLYKRWEKDGKLYVFDSPKGPRLYVFMTDINREVRGLVTLYEAALHEGLIPDDEQMKLTRELYGKLSSAMSQYGYWYPRGITDPPLDIEGKFCNVRNTTFKAMTYAKAGNTGLAAEYFASADKEISDMVEEGKKDEDLGKKSSLVKITEHPYFKATQKEIERIKALSEPEMTKAKNTQDQAKLSQQNEAARIKGLQEQAKKDIADLEAVFKGTFDAVKNVRGEIRWGDAEAYLPKLTEYEGKAVPQIQKALEAFTSKYGNRQDAIKKIYEFKGDAISDAQLSHVDDVLREMAEALALPAKQRKDIAESLLREANSRIDLADKDYRQQAFTKAASLLQLAMKFDPSNEDVKKKLAGIAGEATAADAAVKKEAEDRTWPGHIANFDGPGTTAELADSIRTFLTKHEELMRFVNLRGQPVAVAIRGQWHSDQKNLLGQTTQWGLNALVAYVPDPGKDEALCSEITIRTANEADVKKAPPWNEVAAMKPYAMRASKLPKGSTAGEIAASSSTVTPANSASGSWGLTSWLLWVLLSLANMIAGAAAAESFLKAKLPPAVQTTLTKIQSMRTGLGVMALLLGLLCLIRSLVALCPLSGLLPELSALAIGLMMIKPILTGPAGPTETETTGQTPAAPAQPGFMTKLQRGLAMTATQLETFQVPLGLAAIVLGLLHLIIGWHVSLL